MTRSPVGLVWFFWVFFCTNVQAAPIIEQWEVIKESFFPQAVVQDAGTKISITAPKQAENAALVPFTFALDLAKGKIKSVHIFTDANPILHTATFNLPQPQSRFGLSTRIRLEKNSIVRVIAETSSGKFLMKTVAIKTPGGGCGGGAMTNEAKLRAEAGKMKLKLLAKNENGTQPFVLLIKHPMRTGFERTFQGYYAKAWFMEKIEIKSDKKILLSAKLGPGISANPYFKIQELSVIQSAISIKATDNEDKVFIKKNNQVTN